MALPIEDYEAENQIKQNQHKETPRGFILLIVLLVLLFIAASFWIFS